MPYDGTQSVIVTAWLSATALGLAYMVATLHQKDTNEPPPPPRE